MNWEDLCVGDFKDSIEKAGGVCYYPFGFASEVRHKIGTIALDVGLQLEVLDAICGEIARNGFKNIVIGNAENLVEVIREIKRNAVADRLLNEFYDASEHPPV